MPELPEVESLRLSLLPHLLGRSVAAARLYRRDVLIAPGDPPGGFPRQRNRATLRPKRISPADLLTGAAIVSLARRGKQLAIIARSPRAPTPEPDRALIVQLGMTGSLDALAPGDKPDAHTHALWSLDSGLRIRFHDPRRFGSLRVFRAIADLDAHWAALGPDALTITDADLHAALARARRPIKAALLDQSVLAGVGNIYADEALFLARIHPTAIAAGIPPANIATLAAAIRSILAAAVQAGGSTLRDYADANGAQGTYVASHRVYGRAGLPCTICRSPLSHALLVQRTTVWCPRCQPRPRIRPH
ncbi:MAG TPA: bifunctional DNA-formamidopyrimidine glycosylase/DNA-(apurinic or apyrimidinic site) lyase [Phycisphaerales bacterium]|nr:bifunctional DNA-formamidopyrimidine glycosylase/DNA-(apurinic or apyrimidinic site) lyase [Phycisphaerales bacterium]